MHIHILGICGTFMGGLAALAREQGHTVTGCDTGVYPPMSDQLRALGIDLIEGYGADQLNLRPDMFVVGNEVITGKADEILDFKSGKDSFGLVGEELTAALNGNVTSGEFREGLNAQDGNDHLIYHELTGRLFFDADGDGAGDKVLMAKLGAGTDLAFDDFQFIV